MGLRLQLAARLRATRLSATKGSLAALELTISLPHGDQRLAMTGPAERNLKIIRESLGVNITARDGTLRVSGDSRAVGQAAQVLERLAVVARGGRAMNRQELIETISALGQGRPEA